MEEEIRELEETKRVLAEKGDWKKYDEIAASLLSLKKEELVSTGVRA